MAGIPAKVASRISAGIKQYQPIVAAAKSRDVNESDTVIIITDMLGAILGYDKFTDVTSEHAIRGTYCDLAVKVDGALAMLIEAKAIGMDLKDQHVKQAVDYAVNQGIEWVVLTNAEIWRVYKVTFGKPIEHELVLEFSLSNLNHKSETDIEYFWLLAKEGWQKARLGEYHARRQVLSRFTFGALLLTEPVLNVLRRELRRVESSIKVENEQVADILAQEVIKRDVLEGEKAAEAKKVVSRASKRALREVAPKDPETSETPGAGESSEP